MKTKWIIGGIIGLLMHSAVIAQHKPTPVPKWVSAKGWWMVESNIHSPKQHIIHFYNNDGVLVYKEKLEGIRLNPEKRKTKMHLKQALEAAVVVWEKDRIDAHHHLNTLVAENHPYSDINTTRHAFPPNEL